MGKQVLATVKILDRRHYWIVKRAQIVHDDMTINGRLCALFWIFKVAKACFANRPDKGCTYRKRQCALSIRYRKVSEWHQMNSYCASQNMVIKGIAKWKIALFRRKCSIKERISNFRNEFCANQVTKMSFVSQKPTGVWIVWFSFLFMCAHASAAHLVELATTTYHCF